MTTELKIAKYHQVNSFLVLFQKNRLKIDLKIVVFFLFVDDSHRIQLVIKSVSYALSQLQEETIRDCKKID